MLKKAAASSHPVNPTSYRSNLADGAEYPLMLRQGGHFGLWIHFKTKEGVQGILGELGGWLSAVTHACIHSEFQVL